jgi:hypothetical protein
VPGVWKGATVFAIGARMLLMTDFDPEDTYDVEDNHDR